MTNSTSNTDSAIGSTQCSSAGLITVKPSAAESTEMAGVIMASPKNIAVPVSPIISTTQAGLP